MFRNSLAEAKIVVSMCRKPPVTEDLECSLYRASVALIES